MDTPAPIVTKRPRGRPPKVKRGRKPNAPPISDNTHNIPSKDTPLPIKASGPEISHETSLPDDTAVPMSSKRSSPEGDEYVPPAKRIRAESSDSKSNLVPEPATPDPAGTSSFAAERKAKPTILPARRSNRHATIQATQISEGTLRPPGPPCLEAALNIALRNLESEMWRYLWSYYKKHQGSPLPTPAAVKEACPRVRKAAEAVDNADRELEDAIDEIMRSNSKKRRRGGAGSGKQAENSSDAGPSQTKDADGEPGERRTSPLSEREEMSQVNTAENQPEAPSASQPAPEADSDTDTSEGSIFEPTHPVKVQRIEPRGRRPQRMRMVKTTSEKL